MKLRKIIFTIVLISIVSVSFITWRGLGIGKGTVVQELTEYRGKNNVLKVTPNGSYDWSIFAFDISPYAGQTIEIGITSQVWLDARASVVWHVNNSSYEMIASTAPLNAGQWHTVQGTKRVTLQPISAQAHQVLYLSSNPFNNSSFYIADVVITINGQVVNEQPIYNIDTSLPVLHTKWSFPVAVAIPYDALMPSNPQYKLLRHFNGLTAENEMKPEAIMPNPWTPTGAYRWAIADQYVNYAEANGKSIYGHGLFWHQQIPSEFFKGSGKDGRATIDELYARMEHHIKTVFEKYRGRIEWWEVVNETLADDGNPRSGTDAGNITNLPQNSLFTQIMEDAGKRGMDRYEYIVKAFQWARQYADANGGQNVKLCINDYNIENRGAKQTGYLRLIDYLIANNAPIDGVGIQGHRTFEDLNVKNLGTTIDTIAAKQSRGKNLVVLITELDIALFRANEINWNNLSASRRTLSERDYNTRLAAQTRLYREAFDMFEQKYNQGKLARVTIWGVGDGLSANNYFIVNREDHPLLFDRNFQSKPAFHELIRGR